MNTSIYIYFHVFLVTWVTQVSHSCLSQCRSRDRDRIDYLIAESDSDLSDLFLSGLPTHLPAFWETETIYVRICKYIYVYIYTYICMYMYVFCIYRFICIFLVPYKCIKTHAHIHTCIRKPECTRDDWMDGTPSADCVLFVGIYES